MTLMLDMGTKPAGIAAKTFDARTIFLGDYAVSMEDFLALTEYVLTNTDLTDDDPRLKFVQRIKDCKRVDGWNSGQQRLELSEEPARYRK